MMITASLYASSGYVLDAMQAKSQSHSKDSVVRETKEGGRLCEGSPALDQIAAEAVEQIVQSRYAPEDHFTVLVTSIIKSAIEKATKELKRERDDALAVRDTYGLMIDERDRELAAATPATASEKKGITNGIST